MNEMSRVDVETETPVNPYSLLDAVNRSSGPANTAWLIYLAVMAYLLIAVAGVSHKDLLLGSDVALPILQVKIELERFFLAAPILLVLIHAGLIAKLALLAGKTLELAAAIRLLETTDKRTHPLRLELDNFFFVQVMAGPERSRLLGFLLHVMSWMTLVVMPVALLLYIQLAFLPYHDVAITWAHRIALLADIVLIVFVGIFLRRLETSFFRALWRTGRRHPVGLAATVVPLAAAAIFSLAVATVPGEGVEGTARQADARSGGFVFGYAMPGLASSPNDALLGLFHRSLVVTDVDLAAGRGAAPGATSLSLRGRDLRYARLDRVGLHQADLTGANLDGASLVGADLRGALMGCADLGELLLSGNRAAAFCTSARAANLSEARLAGARMAGIDLRGSRLVKAQLDGAALDHAVLTGANFSSAVLDNAGIMGAWLHGASILQASLRGADLSGAKLQLADFTGAGMQGANLSRANLEGSTLRNAELEGASLAGAVLHGASMAGARIQGSDMTGARVWRTLPPEGEGSAFADMAEIVLRPPGEEELAALAASLAHIGPGAPGASLGEALAGLTDRARNAAWATSPQLRLWQGYAKSAETAVADASYKARLTDYLGRMMCRPRFAGGAVAAGIARRSMAPGFKGDMAALYAKLRGADCAATAALSPRVLRDLAVAVDAASGQ